MRRFLLSAATLLFVSTTALAATPTGVWLSADGRVKVRLTECHGALCGKVVWLKEPTDPQTGAERTDKLNPDASKRGRKMIGLNVVDGLKPQGENKWAGPIYNADEGKSYHVNATLVSTRKIALQGCMLGVFCKTQTWTRVD
jgi:uncharacterized protein (DUF2147 family)